MKKNFVLALPLAVALSVATPAIAGQTMSTTQIKSLFPGSFRAIVHGAVAVKFIAYRSGRIKGVMGSESDRGRWSVRGGALCIVMQNWMDGKKRCSPVTKSGKWYQVASFRFKKL